MSFPLCLCVFPSQRIAELELQVQTEVRSLQREANNKENELSSVIAHLTNEQKEQKEHFEKDFAEARARYEHEKTEMKELLTAKCGELSKELEQTKRLEDKIVVVLILILPLIIIIISIFSTF